MSSASWSRTSSTRPVGGAPAVIPTRQMVEAMLFIARTGCQWRHLPERYGAWPAPWAQWRRWRANGVWAAAMTRLAAIVRVLHDREPIPSKVMVDAQTVRGGRYGPTFHQAGGRAGRTIGTKRWPSSRRAGTSRLTSRRRQRASAASRRSGRSTRSSTRSPSSAAGAGCRAATRARRPPPGPGSRCLGRLPRLARGCLSGQSSFQHPLLLASRRARSACENVTRCPRDTSPRGLTRSGP